MTSRARHWPYKQIGCGGAWPTTQIRMQPIMLFAADELGIDLLGDELERAIFMETTQ